jgi:hypothetical protein
VSGWDNFTSGFFGAVVGGAATFIATPRAIKAERRRSRQEYGRAAAGELLGVVAELHNEIRNMPIGDPTPTMDPWASARSLLDRLHDAQMVMVPQVGNKEIRKRWGSLRAMVGELATAHPIPRGVTGEPTDWTKLKISRARDDVDHYVAYVQRTVEAFIDERPLPAHKDRPYLRRAELDVWTAPDES